MSNYTKSTNFATKDNLPTGDPLKIVKGTEIDTEFNNIATAVSTKTDNASAAITGGSITGITDLAIADGGTGASTATAAINNLLPSQTSNANKYLQTDGTNVSWDAISINTGDITGTLPVANGGTGVTSSTGTGSVVLSNSPTLVTPSLGAATASTLDVSGNVTLSGGTANTIPYLNGSKVVTTGTELYFNGSNLGVGASASYRVDLGSATSDDAAVGIRIGRGGSSTTWSLIDNVGGSGNYRQYSSGTPTLRWLTSTNGTSWSEQMRLNATGLGVGNNNPTEKLDVTGSALVSGSVTASQFYGSFNGAIGNTTAYSGAFTSLSASSTVNISGGTVDGVAYLDGSKNLTTGSVLSFSGVHLTSNRNKDTTYSGTDYTTYPNGFILQNSATPATGLFNSIYFKNNANMQNVFGVVQNSSGYGDFVWAGNSGSYAEWMRLSSSGLTLTSNPTLSGGTANGVTYLNGSKVLTSGTKLTFAETGNETKLGIASISGTSAYTAGLAVNWDDNAFILYGGSGYKILETLGYSTPNVLKFFTNNSEAMRLTSTSLYTASGINVGIGTSSPSYKLHAVDNGNINATSAISNSTAGTSSLARFLAISDAGSAIFAMTSSSYTDISGAQDAMLLNANNASGGIAFALDGTLKMKLDSAGNLGLGVTPSAWSSSYKAISVGYAGGQQMAGGTGNSQALWTTNLVFTGTGATGWKLPNNVAGTSYEQYLGAHKWYNAPANGVDGDATLTQAMTLDASGNLGVGTTSPTSRLHVSASNGDVARIAGTTRGLYFGADSDGVMISTGSAQTGVGTYYNASSDLMYFQTGSTERARIDSSGNLLLNTTSSRTGVNSISIEPSGNNYIEFRKSGSGSSTQIQFNRNTDTTPTSAGSIATTGTTTTYNTSSDYRLKDVTGALTGYKERLMSLQPKQGTWKVDGSEFRGFLAHEFANPYRASVTGEKDAVDESGNPIYQGMQASSSEVMADLVAMVKELITENASLKARLDAANL